MQGYTEQGLGIWPWTKGHACVWSHNAWLAASPTTSTLWGRTFGKSGSMEQHLTNPLRIPKPVRDTLECH